MPSASRPAFLRRFVGSNRLRRPDLGDMGTAFGLDQALDSQLPPADPVPDQPPRQPSSAWRLWLARRRGG